MVVGSRSARPKPTSAFLRRQSLAIAALGLCALLLTLTWSPVASAAGYIWRNVKVGGGGYVPDIVFSPVEPGLAYLRSDMGGAYRWDAAARTWIPLQDANPNPNYRGVESIAPDPVAPDVVYAAVGTYHSEPAAIMRSENRGETWKVIPVPFRMGGNEDGRGLGERLAIDPNDTSILYFGSRFDGLERSTDRGDTWKKVSSFPRSGLGLPASHRGTEAGISFVIFNDSRDARGTPSRKIYVGVADPGEHHLFSSNDAGQTWTAVIGGPPANLLPLKAALDSKGVLYISYSNAMGPSGITDGAVFKLDTHSGAWTDITPGKGTKGPAGGYLGISVDRQHIGTLVVATIDRAGAGDTIWRSTDGGRHWSDLRLLSKRDVSAVPFLLWGQKESNFGWWISALAIDPFDANHAAYATGATIYATKNLTDADDDKTVNWRPWVDGVEQTAIITMMSPPKGPYLLSGFGDIGGFAHFDLDRSPPMFMHPTFINTNNIDYASLAPNIVVRSGTHEAHAKGRTATLAYSTDYGKSWTPLFAPMPPGYTEPKEVPYNYSDPYTDAAIVTSADGRTFIVMVPPTPVLTRDRGKTWISVKGLPQGGRPVPDRVDSKRFYAIDFSKSIIYASDDEGAHFSSLPTVGLPSDITADQPTWREDAWPLIATPGEKSDLWYLSKGTLYHSTTGGRSFMEVRNGLKIDVMAFGKAPPGQTYPALFAIGSMDDLRAIWRSDDRGKTWVRVNDAQHEYGRAFRCIAGDPRIFGRVYVGTDGRGIVYGQPAK
ncbi:MAG: hypothetical protein KGI68_00840 [Alphaproteobacteria bacterium]|nr:hypothetical protein [Alphaproteobacteria bacterium]